MVQLQPSRGLPHFPAWQGPGSSMNSSSSRCHADAPRRATGHDSGPHKSSLEQTTSPLSDYQHPISIEQFRQLGYETVDLICDYLRAVLPHARVVPDIQPGYLRPLLPAAAPTQPDSWQDIKQDFWNKILVGVTHWQSPNNFAWFSANTSLPGVLAEMLNAALNMVGFNWESGPVGTELEMVVLDWLVKLCGLPTKFLWQQPDSNAAHGTSSSGSGMGGASCGTDGASSSSSSDTASSSSSNSRVAGRRKSPGGVIQGTSSEAVLVALLAARARTLAGTPPDAALKLVAYGTNQAHSCFTKATMVAGIPHLRVLPASRDTQFALQPEVLEQAVTDDLRAALLPFYFLASIGTTSSCAVDPISELADVCAKHHIWMHVDAAWAGTAAILPEQRHWFEGLNKVDSYSFNPYKWMLTPMGVCACWFDDSTWLREALSLTPTYLRGRGGVPDFKDWEIPLGRRFRALDLWFVLRMYGSDRLQALVRHHIALGEWLGQQVAADIRFELAAPPRFGLVCLRLKGVGNEGNRALLAAVTSAGLSHMVGTDLDGLFTLRVAIGQANTQLEHVRRVWSLIQEQAGRLLLAESPGQPLPPA